MNISQLKEACKGDFIISFPQSLYAHSTSSFPLYQVR